MILLDEFDVLIIVGGWNKHIFSRDWVSRYLLPNETLEVEIPVNVDGSPRISSEKVRVAVLGNRLSFTSRKSNDEVLEFVQGLGLKTADYLPHTPVSAFGINLLFQSNINESLSKILQLNDNESLGKLGAKIRTTNIRRQLELGNRLINFGISADNEKLTFDFNFNFSISNLVEFKEKISDNQIVDLKRIALDIVTNTYGYGLSTAEGV
jgi:hypothetical protein